MNRKYVVISTDELSSVDFSKVIQKSADHLLYSLDGTKTLVKFEGETPSFLVGKPVLSHTEILEVISGPEWLSEED